MKLIKLIAVTLLLSGCATEFKSKPALNHAFEDRDICKCSNIRSYTKRTAEGDEKYSCFKPVKEECD